MNRMIISAVAVLLVLVTATVGLISLKKSCEKLADALDEIKETAIEKDREKAKELTNKTIELWSKEEKIISLLIDHREIDEIEQTIKSLSVFARQNDMKRLEENSSVAAERVRHIIDKEKVSAENVF